MFHNIKIFLNRFRFISLNCVITINIKRQRMNSAYPIYENISPRMILFNYEKKLPTPNVFSSSTFTDSSRETILSSSFLTKSLLWNIFISLSPPLRNSTIAAFNVHYHLTVSKGQKKIISHRTFYSFLFLSFFACNDPTYKTKRSFTWPIFLLLHL